MKTLIIIPVLLFSLFLGLPSYSSDFDKGLTAYNNGDYATALKEWKPLAEEGDVDAQYYLGVLYDNGDGVPQDYKEAVRWYTLAAEQGDVDAQYNLDFIHRKGLGVPQDDKEAVWFDNQFTENLVITGLIAMLGGSYMVYRYNFKDISSLPEIKLLELANSNTTGKPAQDQRSNYVYGQQGFNDFDEDYEADFPAILSLSGSSMLIDAPFYVANKSISSNLLGNKTIWKNTKLRNSLVVSQDRLDKSYEQQTRFFLADETIQFSENNQFDFKNTNLTEDLELRHPIGKNNYITLQTTFSISGNLAENRLLFNNQNLILQNLITEQNSGAIHLRYTKKIKNA